MWIDIEKKLKRLEKLEFSHKMSVWKKRSARKTMSANVRVIATFIQKYKKDFDDEDFEVFYEALKNIKVCSILLKP